MGFFDSISTANQASGGALSGFFAGAATSLASKVGINIGAGSPTAAQGAIAQPIAGQAIQAPPAQPVYRVTDTPWYKRPIVIIAGVAAVALVAWKLLRRGR